MAPTQSQVKPDRDGVLGKQHPHTSPVFDHHLFYESRLHEIPMGQALRGLSEGLGKEGPGVHCVACCELPLLWDPLFFARIFRFLLQLRYN